MNFNMKRDSPLQIEDDRFEVLRMQLQLFSLITDAIEITRLITWKLSFQFLAIKSANYQRYSEIYLNVRENISIKK